MTNTRYHFIVAAALIAALGSSAYSIGHAKAPPASVPAPIVSPSPEPGSVTPTVFFHPIEFATMTQDALLLVAQQKMADVVAGQCFADFLLARPMIQTNDLANSVVLAKLRAVSIAVPVDIYHIPWYQPWGRSVMGYRNVGERRIHIRDTSLLTPPNTLCDIASLAGHEILGHLGGGFDHDYYYSPSREFSVPYSINAAFSACCK